MNRFVYLLYGLVVVLISTSVHVGKLERSSSASSGWGSGPRGGFSSGGWSTGGGHK